MLSTAGYGQDLKLTEPEQKDVKLLRVQQENLNLQFQILLGKFNETPEVKKLAEANKALNAEVTKLMQGLAKVHNVDLKTHRLKADGSGFEPIPVEKAEVKK
mgnify:CR=1 FL=1